MHHNTRHFPTKSLEREAIIKYPMAIFMRLFMTIMFRERTRRRHLLSADSRVERLTWCDMLTRFVADFLLFFYLAPVLTL